MAEQIIIENFVVYRWKHSQVAILDYCGWLSKEWMATAIAVIVGVVAANLLKN